jgi:aryl-alcohol dehydrogenase-like predicted oxidoreductase
MVPKAVVFPARQVLPGSTRAYAACRLTYVDLYQIDRGDAGGSARLGQGRKGTLYRAFPTFAWQVGKTLYIPDLRGWTRFVSMRNYDNLIDREEEREMIGFCQAEGIRVIPWSPLARGTSLWVLNG